jgi:hypothetical protein
MTTATQAAPKTALLVSLGILRNIQNERRFRYDRLWNYRRMEAAIAEVMRFSNLHDPNIAAAISQATQAMRTFGNPDSRMVRGRSVRIRENTESLEMLCKTMKAISFEAADLMFGLASGPKDLWERYRELYYAAANAERFLGRRRSGLETIVNNQMP